MKFSKKLLSIGLTVTLLVASSFNINALSSVERIQGKNKYEVAGLIADRNNYDTVIIVNVSDTMSDGLSASGLAGTENAPILLTEKNKMSDVTVQKLDKVKKVYLIGGEDSISKEVEDNIKRKVVEVVRISGIDRTETSYNVAKKISEKNDIKKVMLTNAFKGEADAMSIASVAVREKSPIILTDGNSIPFNIKELESYVIGGHSSMSNKIVESTNSTRLGGIDRFETNMHIVDYFYKNTKEFYVASASELVYALIGSTLAKDIPIILVDKGSDKSILKGASKVTVIGNLNESIIKECINAVNGKNNELGDNTVDIPGFGPQDSTGGEGEQGDSSGNINEPSGEM
ncbi:MULTISPECIES: cell wall-binding repeat-containing protein [unclassified Clostridioides]|uniref:cell wall-binding repeat-containing protein n=1 Tax=unclassified Clostridioides TaxID=2635829 RepID=UPI001D121456|nr:cell wall-binding repeat-containing protein [Clostridioides sp. ZZV14-6048]MCC0739985.1 cell wall-binding repeat-containing protein [Clostridioides sp. ZZV14-5902]